MRSSRGTATALRLSSQAITLGRRVSTVSSSVEAGQIGDEAAEALAGGDEEEPVVRVGLVGGDVASRYCDAELQRHVEGRPGTGRRNAPAKARYSVREPDFTREQQARGQGARYWRNEVVFPPISGACRESAMDGTNKPLFLWMSHYSRG